MSRPGTLRGRNSRGAWRRNGTRRRRSLSLTPLAGRRKVRETQPSGTRRKGGSVADHLTARDVSDLSFTAVTGQVVGTTSRIESHNRPRVTGRNVPSAGGGWTYQRETTFAPSAALRRTIVVRDASGTDWPVPSGVIEFREGQTLTIISGEGHPLGLHDHGTGRTTHLEENYPALRGHSYGEMGCLAKAALALVVLVTFGLALLIMIPWLLHNSRRYEKVDGAIRAAVNEVAARVAASG